MRAVVALMILLMVCVAADAAQHGLLVRCGGAPRTPDNPLSVNRDLLSDPREFFSKQAERVRAVHAITGDARIVFHMLNGWDTDGMVSSAAVLDAMPPERREAFEAVVGELVAGGITVGVYTACKVPLTSDSVSLTDTGAVELFDWGNPRHRRVMLDEIVQPLLDIGVTEIWYDNSSPLSQRANVAMLGSAIEDRGGRMIYEAIPRLEDGSLDRATLRLHGSSALERYIADREREDWYPLPSDARELIAVISAHGAPEGGRRQFLVDAIESRLEQGWSVMLMQGEVDSEFIAALAELPDPEPKGVAVEHPETGEIIEFTLPAGVDPTAIPLLGEILLTAWKTGRDSVVPDVDPCEGRVNVNTAGFDELRTLHGIGPAKAGTIIEYREEHGPFQSLDDLMNVSGIGPVTLREIVNREQACTGE